MRKIRIAMTSTMDEVHNLVQQGLVDQPDLCLSALASSELGLLLEAAQADVVVLAMQNGELPAVTGRLIDEYPHLGVVCVDMHEGSGTVYRLRPNLAALHEVTPSAVVAAIRWAAESSNEGFGG